MSSGNQDNIQLQTVVIYYDIYLRVNFYHLSEYDPLNCLGKLPYCFRNKLYFINLYYKAEVNSILEIVIEEVTCPRKYEITG